MGQKSISGSLALGKAIRKRRNELNLTIEGAASKAGVGTKTWSRYEAGESIRLDKSKGICKVLNWHSFPQEDSDADDTFDVNDYKKHEAWSSYLAEGFGEIAAVSFVIGSDILLDNLQQDIDELSSMPKGSHIGELGVSWLETDLPPQFLMRYDYDFLYHLRSVVIQFRAAAPSGTQIIAHSVIEELALYLMMENSQFLMEAMDINTEFEDDDLYDNRDSWAFDIFDDMDIVTFLYSDWFLDSRHPYHFDHWLEQQFYCKQHSEEEDVE
jgi:transcriptional regulator with XRE-family HTH domain